MSTMSDCIKQQQRHIDHKHTFARIHQTAVDSQSHLQLPDGRLPLLDLLQVFLSDEFSLRLHLGITAGMTPEAKYVK